MPKPLRVPRWDESSSTAARRCQSNSQLARAIALTALLLCCALLPTIAVAQAPARLPSSLSAGSVRPFPNLPPVASTVPELRLPQRALDSDVAQLSLPEIAPPKRVEAKYDLSRIGSRGVGGGLDFYSLEKEVALGRELANEVERESRLFTDPQVNEYINRLTQNLVRNSDAKVPFRVKVIENDEVNAFALPGGFFYVDTGLILAADNEAGLAGVMAHEIAHVAARHATKNATKQQLFNLASIPLIFLGGPAGYAARQVLGIAMPMSFLKFSRDAEREADLLGLEYDYQTGYDPEEFIRLFEKLKIRDKENKNFLARAFSTHPMTADRIKRAQKEIAQHLPAREEYVVDTSEFQSIKKRVQDLLARHRIDAGRVTLPTLQRRGPETAASKDGKDDPNRPTLKRNPKQ